VVRASVQFFEKTFIEVIHLTKMRGSVVDTQQKRLREGKSGELHVQLMHFLRGGGGESLGGALGDEIRSLGDGVVVSSWVKSTNNYSDGMMLIFGFLETLEIEALVEAMEVYGG
ncbi:hypothetical protein Tco_0199074, partial [Tanacetum coccineum]